LKYFFYNVFELNLEKIQNNIKFDKNYLNIYIYKYLIKNYYIIIVTLFSIFKRSVFLSTIRNELN